MSNHKNGDIAQKIFQLNGLIKQKINAEIFDLNLDFKAEKYSYNFLVNNEDAQINTIDCLNKSKNLILENQINNKTEKEKINNNKNINKNNSNLNREKSFNGNKNTSELDKLCSLVENEDKKFDSKIEILKKQILQTLSENKEQIKKIIRTENSNNLILNENNKMNFNNVKNMSINKNNDKTIPNKNEKENIAIIDNLLQEKSNHEINNMVKSQNEKNKTNKSPINSININSVIKNNVNNENPKSSFYNNKIENRKNSYKDKLCSKENYNIIENNNNCLSSEPYNFDTSAIFLKENNSNNTNVTYQNTRLRKNSSMDYKERNFNRTNSINSKSNFLK